MAKKYWDGNYDINTDWGGDESTENLPLPGSAVQKVVKDKFKEIDDNLKGKVGYVHENDGYLYFSNSEADYDKGIYIVEPIKAGDPRYMLKTISDGNRTIFFSSEDSKHFIWYFKTEDRLDSASNFTESINVDYIITNETIGKTEPFSTIIRPNPIKEMSGFTKVDMNLDEYLKDGKSNIQVNLTAPISKQKTTFSVDITILTLETEDITNFHTLQEDNFEIRNSIQCTNNQVYYLEYRFDGSDFIKYTTENLMGTGKRENRRFTVNFPENFNDGRHVCEYRFFITLEDKHYFTNIQRIEFIKGKEGSVSFKEPQILISSMYNADDKIFAEDNNLIINGISQYVPYRIKYAVYNPDGLTNVEIKDEISSFVDSVQNNTFAYYDFQSTTFGMKKINILTTINGVSLNGEGRVVYLNVAESELGINIYNTNLRIDFSSVGKKNIAEDKKNWISYVPEGNYTTTAVFNETFDWSQGWTDNGLVISNGSEVTFDYIPFPKNSNENKYIVGGDNGFVFELEFMTQNVIDENAVVCDMLTEDGTGGLQITGSEIKFIVPGSNEMVSSRFKSEEMNRVVIIIRPQEGIDDKGRPAFRGLVELYMNGILSNVAKYTQDTKFQILGNDGISTFGKKLSFKGVDGADIVIKYIRTYNGVMSPDDVVNNYILFRDNSRDMLSLFTQNNVMNEQGIITPESILKWGNIPVIIFIGRTKTTLEGKEIKSNYAPGAGEGEENNGEIILDDKNWYQTLENTTDKKEVVNMDVIYCNPLNPEKNFKFINAYITPQGTSSMYYPKKNYRIYTQKNNNTRCFFSISKEDQLTYDMMKRSDFGVRADEFKYEPFPGIANKKKRVYSFKDNAQAVKCWCLKADFAETSSSHNTGIARLWGDTLKNSTIKFGEDEIRVFETTAQATIRNKFKNNINGDMPDIRTTIDGFPIVVFGARSYDDPMTFLGQYNFNNDKSTESVFGFCDIDDDEPLSHTGKNNITGEETEITHTLDDMLDQYMTCVETLDNGNLLANFATLDTFSDITEVDKNQNNIYGWEKAFEFRYPEKPDKKDYKNDESGFNKDYTKWHNTHVKPFKHFAEWLYSTRWCDVNGHILPGLSKEEASARKEKFTKEKWDHLDIWKMAAYYIYAMRFGAVDQIVKNSMLTAEGPFARDLNGKQYGHLDTTDITNDKYGLYYKWYYINYDNDTIMGVKNDGHLAYGPEINRKSVEGENNFPIYAGSNSTLWNNLDADEEFQSIVEKADQGLSENLTYNATINMFDVQQVGKWCERIYNKDAEYKYITPYVGGWLYRDDEGNTSEDAGNFADKLFMLQGARTAHRRWWLSRRFSLYDGKWGAGDFLTKYIEVKCDYSSIGDTFSAVAGANAFFGYRINGQTFDNGSSEGGSTTEYKAKDIINWKLFKNINIGDPIALYGANDMVELNLQGLSTGLATLMFQFGNNADLGNKMERLILSIPEESLLRAYSYRVYGDDDTEQTGSLTAFEKFQRDFPNVTEKDFEDNNLTMDGEIEANETSPSYYRILENEKYIYFGKFGGGVRNSSCTALTLNNLTKLQTLKIAGYIGLGKLDLSNNNSLSELDARYSGIKTLSFNNSKIKNLSASTALEELYVNSCDNLKLSNISIDSTSLEYNKGVNLKTISVEKSTGLNTNTSFKNFIIKWVNGGDEFVDITNKKLILNDIYWTGISMKDIKSLINFKYGNAIPVIGTKPRASECKITGTLEMGDYNFSQSDIDLINSFNKSSQDINLNIKFPYANILIKSPESMVAGQTIEISSEIYSDNKDNSNNSYVEYVFVEETNDQNAQLVNYDTGKRYNRLSEETLLTYRNGGISIINNFENRTAEITVKEVICNEDTQMLIAAIVNTGTGDKFDITSLLIKDPTYAINGVINGVSSLNESGTSYIYELMLASNKGYEPIGTVDITWSLSGDGIKYVEYHEISDDKKTLTIKTKNEMPDLETLTSELNIAVLVENYDGISEMYKDFTINKTVLLLNETIILTDISNKEVMEICRNQKWATNPKALTKEEASRISDIGQAFSGLSNTKWSFDEFEYFTNVSVLSDNAFAGSKLTSIVLPSNVTKIGKSIFEGCNELKNVKLSENITEIPSKAFHGCNKLEYFTLPKKVLNIESNAFGNVGVEKILFEGIETNTPKTIFIQKESSLWSIKNNAFENEEWKINRSSDISTISTTNVLNEVSIPNDLILSTDKYNFLLSPGLNKINLESDNAKVYLENDILYTDNSKAQIVRALVGTNEEVKDLDLSNVTNVFAYAFYNCKNINKVIFGELLKPYGLEIGAFYGCTLKEIDLEKAVNLAILNDFTFSNATELDIIKFPQNGRLHTLGYQLFVNCPLTNGVVLPNTIEHCMTMGTNLLNGRQFFRCGITKLVLPDGLHKLPTYFIDECHKLTEITFGKYFTTNYSNAYGIIARCNSLSVVNLPLYSTTLDKNGYYVYKTELDSNDNSFKNIKSGPYEDLNSANKFIEDLKSTPQYNSGKTLYEAVLLSSGTTLIINTELFKKGRLGLFESCYNLTSYNLQDNDDNQIFAKDEDNNIFRTGVVVDNNIIPNNGTLVKIANNIVNYTVPEKYTVIEYGAFSQSNKLKTVSLHNNITEIGMGAFSYCTSLESINLSNLDKVKVIEEDMFASCENLVDVKLSNEVVTIKSQAFQNCIKLEEITIPHNVEKISNRLFFNCYGLRKVKILSRNLKEIDNMAFNNCYKLNDIKLLSLEVPIIQCDSKFEDGTDMYQYHPFGYRENNLAGIESKINGNVLYVPYNLKEEYETNNLWYNPLLIPEKCGFTLQDLILESDITISGTCLTQKNNDIVWLMSEKSLVKERVSVNDSSFKLVNGNNIYDNETYIIYSDENYKEELGRFTTNYGQDKYFLDDFILGSSYSTSLFNANLFSNKMEEEKEETITLTKREYNVLMAKVDQLMKLLK